MAAIISERYGIAKSEAEPLWAQEIRVPDEARLRGAIEEKMHLIEGLSHEIAALSEEIRQQRLILRLVYGGDFDLEEAVWEALEELGAEVQRPPKNFKKEDGWIKVKLGDEDYFGVLEIKSASVKTFDEGGRKQLNDWVFNAADAGKPTHKGIFIGNSDRKIAPHQRDDPFSAGWRSGSAAHGHVAFQSRELLAAVVAKREGRFEKDRFWRAIFGHKGVLDKIPNGSEE